jgi:predicted MFS family arabinose efflux permease
MSLAVIPSTIVAGYVLDRVRNRYLVLIAATLALGLLLPWSFRLGSAAAVVPYMIVFGLATGFIPTALFTLAPETMLRAEHAGLALGILSVGQNLGMFLGPPVAAAFIERRGWGAGVVPLVAVMVVGLAASLWPYYSRPEGRAALSKAP